MQNGRFISHSTLFILPFAFTRLLYLNVPERAASNRQVAGEIPAGSTNFAALAQALAGGHQEAPR
jgi:hypothetical protein